MLQDLHPNLEHVRTKLITGKGRIRVGNLDFDSVSFVKEIGHFNLFSISQICDKQHKVLFTETECLVVSPDFKMPDENQILLKEASLAEIARIQAQEAAEIERKAELQRLDALVAKRLNDEFEIARIEASTELRKSVFGTDIDAGDYAKKMVELVEKRKREIREQKPKEKKNKPMTQAEQRNYMMNYVRSQSHGWTIPQLKKLSFEDHKQKVLDVEDIPIPESAKFMKEVDIEIKQPVLKMSRRKLKARKGIGLHTSTKPESGEVDITSSKIVKRKILRHGGKGYCHLIRANQRGSVFVNFGAMLHNISRDDLVDLYKIVLRKTIAYGFEEDLERAFAENLRIMFDPP
ncbi:hypothetical protein Tco_1114460 [Tanacetum coccineum]|uniref:Uncharacterized protein n=1 Tax=Tanacetum coccineum TaxID=301880 RepID=A0ABQ5IV58_9ASTR